MWLTEEDTSRRNTIALYSVVMVAIALLMMLAISYNQPARGLTSLNETWQYRWDRTDQWRPAGYPSNPPERNGRTACWFRVRIPDIDPDDPALFVYSIDLNAEFFVDEQSVYRFGAMRARGFRGWPWHLIDLPRDSGGRFLTVHVYSDYRDIGLFGDILFGNRAAQIRRIYGRDILRLVVCAVAVSLGLVFFGIYTAVREHRAFLCFAVLAVILSVRVYGLALTRQFVLYAPLFWEYVRLGSYAAVPLVASWTLGEVIGDGTRRVARWLTAFFGAVFGLSMGTALTGILPIYRLYGVNDAAVVVGLTTLAVLTLRAGIRGNAEAALLSVNFVCTGLFMGYSLLMFNGVLGWRDEVDYLILLHLSIGLLFVLIRRYVLAQKRLRAANATLESKVEERTQELEKEKQRLRKLSITDELTDVFNRSHVMDRLRVMMSEADRYRRSLSVIMLDLDHFKQVNDEHGHQTGDAVLSEAAKTIKASLRQSDVCGRYGGEEFLVVLPQTGLEEAAAVAERIRARIQKAERPQAMKNLTISGGVAEMDRNSPDKLLKEADLRLYRAKHLGRNRIVTEADQRHDRSERIRKPQ